ncbi:RNA polymerase sigma factor [Rugosimonospora africana]|uniref:RNA polymerase sigma factor n=1 Tax=Rugosimonospora africana TaxID=556532 RepID=UPI001EF21E45|nr:RNA polymerase sigma factor [Rugosimonospora africana]
MSGDGNLTDALHSAVAGDAVGFAALWRSLQPDILRYLRVVVGHAAEDVASETWLQAARDLNRFEGDFSAFRVWLFRIARHRGIDERRRALRRKEEPADFSGEEIGDPQVRDVALEVLEDADTAWALAVIASLPPDQAEAVMLRVVAGLSVAATAEVLDKQPGAVRVATMRGLRRLAAHPQVQERNGNVKPDGLSDTSASPARSDGEYRG